MEETPPLTGTLGGKREQEAEKEVDEEGEEGGEEEEEGEGDGEGEDRDEDEEAEAATGKWTAEATEDEEDTKDQQGRPDSKKRKGSLSMLLLCLIHPAWTPLVSPGAHRTASRIRTVEWVSAEQRWQGAELVGSPDDQLSSQHLPKLLSSPDHSRYPCS
ncbi:hypothetical protein TREES_T100020299 [Tupaia chinensis]|uniref:Uncharacterized protein n=1 Tax=Tupaia chinensis TaxID=246437 RepID=L9L4P1_TUPCH|nr:hypothetical protein TREES_T100020299 [Tupaia chinensis]